MVNSITIKGGVMARIGHKLDSFIKNIQKERITRGRSQKPISIEKITNLMVKHKDRYLDKIAEDIINLEDEELEKKWK